MESYQIIAGFSDIKAEFRTKTKTIKTMEELKLWFSVEEDVLYAHDHADHELSMALAIFSKEQKRWLITFKSFFGIQVIEWIIGRTDLNTLAKAMNEENESHGFYAFN